ncbi:MAG: hypothetical protein IT279_05985 [Ignavibacteriaceae bacterium]|nr:hypothetical protein [Ignavibacteriaceae bacterium]
MKKILVIFALSSLLVSAQQSGTLSGSLSLDSKNIGLLPTVAKNSVLPSAEKKKPLVNGLLSLVLPGAGQFMAESYIEAGIFAALEITAISFAVINDGKGDDQTNSFQKVADDRWSVVKYAQWLNTYKNAAIPIDPNTSLRPWERVNWDSLNTYESTFSHRLPKHGEQQYYELIGKYHQYSPGWDEFNPANSNNAEIPPIFLSYAGMRGKANDYYNNATKAVLAIYINHFLSAVHAVWATALYNNNLSLNLRFDENEFRYAGNLSPRLTLKANF